MEMKGRRYWIEYAKDKWEEMNHVMVKDYEKIFKHLFLQLIEKYLKIVLVDSIHEKNIEKKYPLFLKKFEKQIASFRGAGVGIRSEERRVGKEC